MDAFVLIEWVGSVPVLRQPATVGLPWRLEELDSPDDDSDGFTSGERGFLGVQNLVPLRPPEFDAARAALRSGPEAFMRTIDVLVDRAARRWV